MTSVLPAIYSVQGSCHALGSSTCSGEEAVLRNSADIAVK